MLGKITGFYASSTSQNAGCTNGELRCSGMSAYHCILQECYTFAERRSKEKQYQNKKMCLLPYYTAFERAILPIETSNLQVNFTMKDSIFLPKFFSDWKIFQLGLARNVRTSLLFFFKRSKRSRNVPCRLYVQKSLMHASETRKYSEEKGPWNQREKT